MRKAIKEKLNIDIFPYMTAKRLLYKTPEETVALTLIKCSISDATKRILSLNVPLEYKWLYPFYAAEIAFAPRDRKIFNYLVNNQFAVSPIRRARRSASKRKKNRQSMANATLKGTARAKQGFAAIDKDRLFQIARSGGKTVQALGKAHRWTPVEARQAEKIGRKARTGRK